MAHLKTIDKVLVLMAMEQEARPFIEKHGLKPVPIPAAPATVVSRSRSKVSEAFEYQQAVLIHRALNQLAMPMSFCCCRQSFTVHHLMTCSLSRRTAVIFSTVVLKSCLYGQGVTLVF